MRAAFFESCTRSAGYSFIYGSKSTGAIRNFVGSICVDNTLHMAYTKNISDKSAESAGNFVGSHGLIITVSAFTHLLVSKLSTLCLNGG